jgi:hypothetical protein
MIKKSLIIDLTGVRSNSSLRGKHMKILIKNLRRILLVQLFIAGATLSITATNAGAAALPCAFPDTESIVEGIGFWSGDSSYSSAYGEYLTIGEIDEADFRNECKNFTKFRKVFRNKIKTTHENCSGVGEKCEYSGSPGCGLTEHSGSSLRCACEIEFTYCTETATSNNLRDSKRGK